MEGQHGAAAGGGRDRAGPPVAVRRLVPADSAAVRRLAADLRRYFSPHDLAEIETLLRAHPSGWVAIAGQELAGFLLDAPGPEAGTREIAWMAVATPRQGLGIGSLLLQELIAWATAEGLRALEVSTVAESAGYAPYAATRAFYHRRGFRDLRIDPDYYWPGGDRLVLRRPLP